MKPNWMQFVRLWLPEGVDGGGSADPGGSGAGESAGAGEGVAGAETPAPAATFLTESKQDPAGEQPPAAPPAGEAKEPPPPSFDIKAVTLPEGVALDEELGKSFAEILGDEKLSPQERGQKFIDLHTEALKKAAETAYTNLVQQHKEAYESMNNNWRAQIKELPEFKANPDAEAGKVLQALVSVGAGEDFFKALDLTGAGNNPAILQILHRLTSPYFEGKAVSGQSKTPSARRLGENIYTSATRG